MTGIERLRELASGINPRSVWSVTSDEYDNAHGLDVEHKGGQLRDFLADIADQIEREHGQSVETVRSEAMEAWRWVCDHGGLDHVKAEWRSRSNLKRQLEKAQAKVERQQRHIEEIQAKLSERRDKINVMRAQIAELRKRAMPEGMEWPTVDGEPVVIGERMRSCGIEGCKVVGIDPASSRLILASDHIEEGKATYFPDSAEYCHRPAPKVLDADGVEIREGDTVYHVKDGSEMTVCGIEGEWLVVSVGGRVRHDIVTHRAPVLAADGEPLEVGQTVWDERGDELQVLSIENDYERHVTCHYEGIDGIKANGWWLPRELTHQRPVLDADGVPIREGDTVYGFSGQEYEVTGLCEYEPSIVHAREVGAGVASDELIAMSGALNSCQLDALRLTHTKPEPRDSWERIEEDAEKDPCSYFGFDGEETCGKCPASGKNCEQTMARDIVRRARALAERERGE